jgi:hypothetical protein
MKSSTQQTDCASPPNADTITPAQYQELQAEIADLRLLVDQLIKRHNGEVEFWRNLVFGVNEHLKIDTRTRAERRAKTE